MPHFDRIHALARRLCRPPLDPDEFTQETYLRACAAHGRFTPGSDMRAALADYGSEWTSARAGVPAHCPLTTPDLSRFGLGPPAGKVTTLGGRRCLAVQYRGDTGRVAVYAWSGDADVKGALHSGDEQVLGWQNGDTAVLMVGTLPTEQLQEIRRML